MDLEVWVGVVECAAESGFCGFQALKWFVGDEECDVCVTVVG